MIEYKDVEIKYGDFVAMEDLNLTVNDGEFFTFLGPSGCGKTTTLRALVGFLTPTRGEILVDGQNIIPIPVEKRGIGMVFQSYALFPTMNVYDNIAYGLRVKKMAKDLVDKKVREIAETVALTEEQLTKPVAALSGGQQQRVALARAVVLEPKILCLDEPLSNLDAKLRVELRGELKRLQRQLKITTLYVTHDQEEALTLSDRIAVFNNGRLEQVGTPYEIYNNSNSEFVCDFIGDINRFGRGIIDEINQQCQAGLDDTKTAFVRIERVYGQNEKPGSAAFAAKVIDKEYNGIYTKYIYEAFGQTFKNIEKNDGVVDHNLGDTVQLHVSPADIMQF